jgi:hydroxyethylthiazole kinase-like uncharacterized protein yjeF
MRSPDQVLTAEQMRDAEQRLVDKGITIEELMQRAGRGAADWIWRVAMGRPVTVLCGPGNNGGDGYVIAHALRSRGLAVQVVAPSEPATQASRAARAVWGEDFTSEPRGGVLVDCLFGSGLSRPLSDHHASLLAALASAHDHVVAVDLPSGVSTDDGALLGAAVRCDLTLALGAWKPAHFLMPAIEIMGQRRCIDIGIGPAPGAASVFQRPCISLPSRSSHKYSRGLVGIVVGEMPGAALLAAVAAMRSGAGYVKLLSQHPLASAPASLVVEEAPLSEALADARWSAMLVGPGLGRDDSARARLAATLERGLPTVLDADALHLLDDELLEGVDGSRLLVTPHDGELVALCNTFGIVANSKAARALSLAETTGLTVLAKGPDTLLATPVRRLAYFEPAPSWLSVAGTGDVLAGIAASRLATGRDPFSAAGEAVWLHGEAARIAGPALTADDLAHAVSSAYARFS